MSERANEKRDSKMLAAKCAVIAARYGRRLAEPGKEKYRSPATNAPGDLRIRVYKLARQLVGHAHFAELGINPFFGVLLRVFAELGMNTKNDRNRARLIAKELRFADENNVPPNYLIGFIHQVGGRKRIERLQCGRTAPKAEVVKQKVRNTGDKRKRANAPRPRRRRKQTELTSRRSKTRSAWRKG